MSETRDAIGFRQQLNTTLFETFELEIVNYPVHTWTENGRFMQNLTSSSVPFWLVLLTEQKVLHCYMLNVVYRCLGSRTIVPILRILFSRLSMLPSFRPLLGNSLNSLRAPYCYDRQRFKIARFCENFMILFNFYWHLGLDSFPR